MALEYNWLRETRRRRAVASAIRKSSSGTETAVFTGNALFAASQDRGHHARAAATVHNGHNPQGLFVGHVGNHIFPHQLETQRTRGQVRAAVALVGSMHQGTDGIKDLRNHPVGGIWIVGCDILADLVDVDVRFRVESVTAHTGRIRRRSASVFSIKRR
jgi:hypothetical protein